MMYSRHTINYETAYSLCKSFNTAAKHHIWLESVRDITLYNRKDILEYLHTIHTDIDNYYFHILPVAVYYGNFDKLLEFFAITPQREYN